MRSSGRGGDGTGGRWRRAPLLLPPLAAIAAAFAPGLPAAEDDGAAFRAAVARSPAVAAARLAATAARRAEAAAAVLPDPMLSLDYGRERPRMGDDMTMYGAMIEQALPRWGERDAMRMAAAARGAAARAAYAAAAGEQAAGVAAAIAEAEAARDGAALARRSRERAAALREAVRARIGSGAAMIGEQLALDTRIERLDLRLADFDRRAADALAELRGRLGLPPEAPLPPFAAPDPDAAAPEMDPARRSAAAMRLEALAMEREAEARGNPETALGLAWEREAAGAMDESDKLVLSLRVSLPVHRPAYAAAADAARARARAAGHEAEAAAWMARSRIERARRAARQAERAQAAADAAAARAETEYAALLRQVGTGQASIAAAIDLLDAVAEAGGEAVMARLDSRMALADLWRLAPPELPEPPAGSDP